MQPSNTVIHLINANEVQSATHFLSQPNQASAEIEIVCGNISVLTPPIGWDG